MTIKEALKSYFADNMFIKITRAIKLENDLKTLVDENPKYSFFIYLIEQNNKGRFIFPEDVVKLCTNLKINTLEDLENWVNNIDSSTIMSIINPKIDFDLTVNKTNEEIKQMIKEIAIIEKLCLWDFGDPNYSLVSEDQLKEILKKCPINRKKYIANTFDCEDFARTTKSWLSLHEVGDNIAIGNAEVNFYKNNKIVFSHGINIVPLSSGKVVCVEPQTDAIWPADKPEFSFSSKADTMKFRLIQF